MEKIDFRRAALPLRQGLRVVAEARTHARVMQLRNSESLESRIMVTSFNAWKLDLIPTTVSVEI